MRSLALPQCLRNTRLCVSKLGAPPPPNSLSHGPSGAGLLSPSLQAEPQHGGQRWASQAPFHALGGSGQPQTPRHLFFARKKQTYYSLSLKTWL